MMKTNSLHDVVNFIQTHDDFLVVCHHNPDGDALGSLIALTVALRKLGKQVQAVCADPVPHKYFGMPYANLIIQPGQARPARTAICVDCAEAERMGSAGVLYEQADDKLCIDHHQTSQSDADVCLIDPTAAATGELIYELICALHVPMDANLAVCILAAISTDTGHFSYGNTTPRSFRCAAALLEAGADLKMMCRNLYKNRTFSATALLGIAITKIEMLSQGKAALTVLTQADFSRCGAAEAESEGIIDYVRDIETTHIAALIRECASGDIKVSLRSKGTINVADLCATAGGGGHLGAAGVTFREKTLDEVLLWTREILLKAVE